MDEQPAVVGEPGQPLGRARRRCRPRPRGCARPTPRSRGQPGRGLERVVGAGERRVDADQPACRRPAGTARSRPARPSRPSGPWRSVTPYAHDTRTPTSAQASAMTSRLPSMALGDSWWSMIAVHPLSSASSAPSRADHAIVVEVEGDVEPPPDLLEDRRGSRSASPPAPACPAPAPSTGGGGRRPGPGWSTARLVGRRPVTPAGHRQHRCATRPSTSCRAAATAPAVGTRPISPTPLTP